MTRLILPTAAMGWSPSNHEPVEHSRHYCRPCSCHTGREEIRTVLESLDLDRAAEEVEDPEPRVVTGVAVVGELSVEEECGAPSYTWSSAVTPCSRTLAAKASAMAGGMFLSAPPISISSQVVIRSTLSSTRSGLP
jgi:hypothetical protein